MDIPRLLFVLLILLATSVKAVEQGEFCVNNRLHTNVSAVGSNLSIGITLRNEGKVVYPEEESVFHLRWGKQLCLATDAGDRLVIHEKTLFGSWKPVWEVDTFLLDDMEVEIGRAGRINQLYGINLKYKADGELPSPSSWMMELYSNDDTPLNQICMPGTHNTGSYEISLLSGEDPFMDKQVREILEKLKFPGLGLPVKELVALWAKTQDLDTYGQLMKGARYLDIRARMINDKLMTVHQLQGASLAKVISDVRRFVEEHPGEVVIFHIGETKGMSRNDRKKMYSLLRDEIGERLVSPSMGTGVTLPQMHLMGKQVIVVARDSGDDPMIWNWNRTLSNTWYDKNRPDELLESLRRGIGYRSNNQFYVSQMILTARDEDIKHMATPGYPSTLYQLVETIRYPSGMMKYLMNAAEQRDRQVNIILQDFIEDSDIFQACMGENLRYLQ